MTSFKVGRKHKRHSETYNHDKGVCDIMLVTVTPQIILQHCIICPLSEELEFKVPKHHYTLTQYNNQNPDLWANLYSSR